MVIPPVKLDYPGLLCERLPSGSVRYRVRMAKNKAKRTRLHVTPDHPNFREHYHAARQGIQLPPETDAEEQTITNSIGWLVQKYIAHMDTQVDNGQLHAGTRQYRVRFANMLREKYGEFDKDIPTAKIIEMRDGLAATPGTADTFIKSIRAMYAWAADRGMVDNNPAAGIRRISGKATGATPWTIGDLEQYRRRHPAGTTAHLALTILMFTACRIGDACRLGRRHETIRSGVTWLKWQPEKRGSAPVIIPMLPPLMAATRAQDVIGETYLLTEKGHSFTSKNALGNRFRKWCDQAGLKNRSAHGVRKAAGYLLAEHGATQYQIMAIHGHSEAETSEIYTRGVARDRLASDAMELLANMDW